MSSSSATVPKKIYDDAIASHLAYRELLERERDNARTYAIELQKELDDSKEETEKLKSQIQELVARNKELKSQLHETRRAAGEGSKATQKDSFKAFGLNAKNGVLNSNPSKAPSSTSPTKTSQASARPKPTSSRQQDDIREPGPSRSAQTQVRVGPPKGKPKQQEPPRLFDEEPPRRIMLPATSRSEEESVRKHASTNNTSSSPKKQAVDENLNDTKKQSNGIRPSINPDASSPNNTRKGSHVVVRRFPKVQMELRDMPDSRLPKPVSPVPRVPSSDGSSAAGPSGPKKKTVTEDVDSTPKTGTISLKEREGARQRPSHAPHAPLDAVRTAQTTAQHDVATIMNAIGRRNASTDEDRPLAHAPVTCTPGSGVQAPRQSRFPAKKRNIEQLQPHASPAPPRKRLKRPSRPEVYITTRPNKNDVVGSLTTFLRQQENASPRVDGTQPDRRQGLASGSGESPSNIRSQGRSSAASNPNDAKLETEYDPDADDLFEGDLSDLTSDEDEDEKGTKEDDEVQILLAPSGNRAPQGERSSNGNVTANTTTTATRPSSSPQAGGQVSNQISSHRRECLPRFH
ncbi:hypothetical protein K474DRAFT_1648095 [Panus rudis PR-1116 ss-1]|nr:hypothetical protein K474DRAFT_1648095 [Panus rudis PR-1116 ss-1]